MSSPAPNRCPVCGQVARIELPLGMCAACLLQVAANAPAPLAPVNPSLPSSLGDYEILEEIGRGGMGVVYKARHKSLNRLVALKIMLGGQFATAQARARFKVEAETTAELLHPHIVAIHDVGEHEGSPYLVMDCVAGRGLDLLARERPLPARTAATYLAAIAEAIAYAHAKGVLHRDLKPSNVLIDDQDEVRVTDFGLAKRMETGEWPLETRTGAGAPTSSPLAQPTPETSSPPVREPREPPNPGAIREDLPVPTGHTHAEVRGAITLSGQALGSPNFMPPEQAAGQHHRIGPTSDVYGMGATLYYLVTGRPPFVGETIGATTRQVMENEPVAPRALNPKVPRDLETICLKCLEKDPARRYLTARELADELHRFLRDEPIRARPPGALERGWRWCRRKPALAAAIAVVAVLSIVSTLIAVRLELTRFSQQREFYYASLAQAQSLIRQGSVDRAREVLLNTPEPPRHWEWGYLMAQCHQEVVTVREATASAIDVVYSLPLEHVKAMAFDSTSRRLGALTERGAITMWEVPSGRLLWSRTNTADTVESMVFHPNAEQVVLVRSNRVTICSSANGQPLGPPTEVPGEVVATAWHRSDQIRLAVASNGRLRFHVIDPGQPSRSLAWTVPRTEHTRFTTDGERLTIGNLDGLSVVRWADGEREGRFEPDPRWRSELHPDGLARHAVSLDWEGRVHLLDPDGSRRRSDTQATELLPYQGRGAFSPDGRWYCIQSDGRGAHIVETATGALWLSFPHRVVGACFSPDSTRVVVLDSTLAATLYQVPTRRAIRVLRGHELIPDRAVFSPDGRLIATADSGGAIKVWSGHAGRELLETGGLSWAASYSSDGRQLSFGPFGGGLYVCDADSGRRRWHLHRERQASMLARFSPDGRHLAADDQNGGLNLWDLESGGLLRTLREGDRSVGVLNYSPDGRFLAAGYADGATCIWDARTGALRHRFPVDSNWVVAASFSRDNRWLFAGAYTGPTAGLWDVETGQSIRRWVAHSNGTSAVRFHPDGRRLATAGNDLVIRLWELRSGRLIRELAARGMVVFMDFSPDGRRLACWSDKANWARKDMPSLQLWDVDTGRLLILLEGHTDGGCQVLFHPDGRRLLTASFDQSVRQWEAFPWHAEDYASKVGTRPPTQAAMPDCPGANESSTDRSPPTLAARIKRYAAGYWRDRLEAEARNDQPPDAVDRSIFLPFDRSTLPARDPAAAAHLLDLSAHYTDTLDGSNLFSYDDEDNDLRELPPGLHQFGTVRFDVRGVIRLRDRSPTVGFEETLRRDFPERTQPIRVGTTVTRLHTLGGSTLIDPTADGTPIALLRWRYVDGSERTTPAIYGRHLRNWWSKHDPRVEVTDGRLAWTGSSPACRWQGGQLRLYHFTLENPRPDAEVASIEWIGGQCRNAPFIAAMTVE